jgi:hypothetical protein
MIAPFLIQLIALLLCQFLFLFYFYASYLTGDTINYLKYTFLIGEVINILNLIFIAILLIFKVRFKYKSTTIILNVFIFILTIMILHNELDVNRQRKRIQKYEEQIK